MRGGGPLIIRLLAATEEMKLDSVVFFSFNFKYQPDENVDDDNDKTKQP